MAQENIIRLNAMFTTDSLGKKWSSTIDQVRTTCQWQCKSV
jgi:hypothetical protein